MKRLLAATLMTAMAAAAQTPDALMRAGRYADAARAWGEQLQSMPADAPEHGDLENRQALYGSIGDVPPQAIAFARGDRTIALTRNTLGTWDVHARVGEREVDWILDTGANLSTLVESEAKALGLTIRESTATVRGSTGAANALRLAVAPSVRVGPATLSHVVFIVLPDAALYIPPLDHQIRGILGMPALRAFRRFAVDAGGALRFSAETKRAVSAPLRSDGWSPIVDVRHNGHVLHLLLDTGANVTSLFPSARAALSAEEITALGHKDDRTGGAGAIVSRSAEVVPLLHLEIGARSVDLHNVTLLASAPADDGNDGVLGIDALRDGFALDFTGAENAGRLTIGGSR